jgi:hypothetical protein
MKLPIKINNRNYSGIISKIFKGQNDPRVLLKNNINDNEYENCIKSFKLGVTWKSTYRERQKESDEIIIEILKQKNNISFLEIGISGGLTTIDLIKKIKNNYQIYYATDVNLYIYVYQKGHNTFFYHPESKECIMIANDYIIIYNDDDTNVWIRNNILKKIFRKAPAFDINKCKIISFIHPKLREMAEVKNNIKIIEYNMFNKWPYDKVGFIKIANVLNYSYFDNNEITKVLKNIKQILNDRGYLAVIDNREKENLSLYQKNENKFELVKKINNGCDIDKIVVNI